MNSCKASTYIQAGKLWPVCCENSHSPSHESHTYWCLGKRLCKWQNPAAIIQDTSLSVVRWSYVNIWFQAGELLFHSNNAVNMMTTMWCEADIVSEFDVQNDHKKISHYTNSGSNRLLDTTHLWTSFPICQEWHSVKQIRVKSLHEYS